MAMIAQIAAVVFGYILSVIGVALSLGARWSLIWAGLILMAAGLLVNAGES